MSLPVMKLQGQKNISALVKKEIDPDFSRETGTLLAGEELKFGELIGKVITPAEGKEADAGKLVPWDPAATDGSQKVEGVCIKACAADEDADLVNGVLYIARHALVYGPEINWPSAVTGAQKSAAITDMADRRTLIVRN